MAAARDKLVHHYFGVNYEIVWAICKEDLKGIDPKIRKSLSVIKDSVKN